MVCRMIGIGIKDLPQQSFDSVAACQFDTQAITQPKLKRQQRFGFDVVRVVVQDFFKVRDVPLPAPLSLLAFFFASLLLLIFRFGLVLVLILVVV